MWTLSWAGVTPTTYDGTTESGKLLQKLLHQDAATLRMADQTSNPLMNPSRAA